MNDNTSPVLTCLVVDDEQHARQALCRQIERHCPALHVVQTASSAPEAAHLIESLAPDVVFLDVRMPHETGLQLLDRFPQRSFHVVFCTTYHEYAVDALRREAFDYLLKPVDPEELKACVHRMVQRIHGDPETSRKIELQTSGHRFFVRHADILSVEASGSYATFYLLSGRRITVSKNLRKVEELLSDDQFFRVHNSQLVRMSHVESLNVRAGTLTLRGGRQVPQMAARTATRPHREPEHLVEVAVVQPALPVDADQVAAHHRVEVGVAVRGAQQRHVGGESALGHQRRPETLDRHVRERQQVVEADPEALAEHAPVVGLERLLGRRQRRALGVVDEIQQETAVAGRVAEFVEALQAADAGGIDALAALRVDVVLEIAGQRRGDLDALLRQELGEILVAGLEQNGEVAPVDHAHAHAAGHPHEAPEMRIQLRRTPGEVEDAGTRCTQGRNHLFDGRRIHRLGPVRSGGDMTMLAGLVADVAEVDLEGVEAASRDGREVGFQEQGQDCMHRGLAFGRNTPAVGNVTRHLTPTQVRLSGNGR
jgi:two-component system LytT family response regulator